MSILDTAIGWVAPPLCVVCSAEGWALCQDCANSQIIPYGPACWSCGVRSPGGRTCPRCRLPGPPCYVWVATTYEAAASQLLKAYKFSHLRAAADSLADIMVANALDFFDQDTFQEANYLVVPVPTATSRLRHRGFDHSNLLASKIARRLGLRVVPALGRLGQSRQVGSKRPERLTQMHGKFYVRLPNLVANRRVLLVDDVVTTGGTLRAATAALRQSGAKRVDALVFAKRL